MKKLLQIPLLLVALFLTSIPISAHDFYWNGIYYDVISSTGKTVEVTFRGDYYYSYSNEYTGMVTIPETVTYSGTTYNVVAIRSRAFLGCRVTSITIPNSVLDIGSSAFEDCDDLTSVTIGNSIRDIGDDAFLNCESLAEINISDLSAWCKINFNGSDSHPFSNSCFWNENCKLVLNGSEINDLIIPNDISFIKDRTFMGCNSLTSVTIPNSVTSIGSYSFGHIGNFSEVSIPNSVISIDRNAFNDGYGGYISKLNYNAGCDITTFQYYVIDTLNIGDKAQNITVEGLKPHARHLKKIIVNENNNEYDSRNNCNAIINSQSNTLVLGCRNTSIPNSVTSIGNSAFYNCDSLPSIIIPNSVNSIEDRAFSSCDSLTGIIIPNSVAKIGNDVFSGCSLKKIIIEDGAESLSLGCNTNGGGSSGLFLYLDSLYIGRNIEYTIPPFCPTHSMAPQYARLKYVTFGNMVTKIGQGAFRYCTGLTSVTIGNSVTSIGNNAFENCTGLTSVTIGNSVTSIGKYAFNCDSLKDVNITDLSAWCKINFESDNANPLCYAGHLKLNGTEITNLVIPDDITEIKSYAFYGCTGLTSVAIPNSVTSIGNSAFYGCTGLTSVAIPNSVTSIGSGAFYGCNKLIDGSVVATTQTTATINITSPTQYNVGLYYNDSNKKQAENGVVKLTGLSPNETQSYYDLALIINGIYCPIKDISFTTRSFDAYLSGRVTASSVTAKGSYTEGDVTILGEGINYGSKVSEYDGKNTITVNNLDPNSSYTIYYAVNTQEGGVYTASETYTTSALELTTQEAKPTSTTSVRLLAATNCDATEGTGFEWRRYDAPDELPSSKVSCPVVDGVLVGSLRGVKDDVYYKYRPYYTSSSGNTYYGEWIAFFTGDANVYFEPDVRTYDDIQVINNSATVKGYALEGTDVITAQGFEYWKTGSTITPSSTENRMIVNASGISMSATLANLEYNSTYKYRAFVTTAQGTTYGDEVEFSTGNDPAGIDYIEIDADEMSVTLRENPATGTAWVKIAGAAGEEVQYTLTSMSGAMVANGTVLLDGEWNAIDLNCSAGMYLLTINDGTQVKTLRLIVK